MSSRFKKALSLILCFLLAITCFSESGFIKAYAEKHYTTHDIAIVFDNSASMYGDGKKGNDRWCQALYAIEVFAAMMDYEHGDKLSIFPMGAIEIGSGGQTVSEKSSFSVNGAKDVKNIEKVFSPKGAPTILRPAYYAMDYLNNSGADEKWLIILTDGEFYYDRDDVTEKSEKKSPEWLDGKIGEIASSGRGVKVQYLGFAEASKIKGSNFDADNVSSPTELTSKLIEICNKIFKRNKISASNGSFSIDVSMRNIVAFVQGKTASVNSLKSNDGKDINQVNNVKIEAATEKCGSHMEATIADVAGNVVTFGECDSGSYKLDYTGSNVQIFYEPDVYVKGAVFDEDGQPVVSADELAEGDYTVVCELVDKNGKEDHSNLLGNVTKDITYTLNGQTKPIKSGEKIHLKAGDTLESINGKVTYLDDYTLEVDNEGFGLPSISIPVIPKLHDLKIDVSGGKEKYLASEMEAEGVYKVTATFDGTALTTEQYSNLNVTAAVDGVDTQVEQKPDGIYVYLKHKGTADETEGGSYEMLISATYSNPEDKTDTSKSAAITFSIEESDFVMKLSNPSNYIQRSKFDEAEPITLTFNTDGQPLTDEQLNEIQVSVSGGLSTEQFEITPIPGASKIQLKIKDIDAIENGKYEITVKAEGPLGASEKETEIEIGNSAAFWKWLCPLLWILAILLLIAAAVMWWLTRKALPYKIVYSTETYIVNGSPLDGGNDKPEYTGGGKKEGSLRITAPVLGNVTSEPDLSLHLKAKTRRITNVDDKVITATINSLDPNTTVSLAGHTYEQRNGNYYEGSEELQLPLSFDISGQSNRSFNIQTQGNAYINGVNRRVTASYNVTIKFKKRRDK